MTKLRDRSVPGALKRNKYGYVYGVCYKKNKTNINKKYLKYILKRNQMKKYKLNEHSLSEVYN